VPARRKTSVISFGGGMKAEYHARGDSGHQLAIGACDESFQARQCARLRAVGVAGDHAQGAAPAGLSQLLRAHNQDTRDAKGGQSSCLRPLPGVSRLPQGSQLSGETPPITPLHSSRGAQHDLEAPAYGLLLTRVLVALGAENEDLPLPGPPGRACDRPKDGLAALRKAGDIGLPGDLSDKEGDAPEAGKRPQDSPAA